MSERSFHHNVNLQRASEQAKLRQTKPAWALLNMGNTSDETDWSVAQQHVLSIVPKISSMLSIAASLWIVVEVFLFSSPKKHYVYHKMLGVMALWDILSTALGFFPSTWSQPSSTRQEDGSVQVYGNTASCTAQGMFVQLHMAGPVYLATLAVYFMLVITRSYNEEKLKKRNWETLFHLIPLLLAGATSMASVALQLFRGSQEVPWCWIHDHERAYAYQWGFFFGPIWTCMVVMISAQMSVFQSVKIQEERMKKYLLQPATAGDGTRVDSMSTVRDGESIGGSSTPSATERQRHCGCLYYVRQKIAMWKSYMEHLPRTVEVMNQSLSYTCAFLLSNIFILIQYTYEHHNSTRTPFTIILFQAIFQPLQVSQK